MSEPSEIVQKPPTLPASRDTLLASVTAAIVFVALVYQIAGGFNQPAIWSDGEGYVAYLRAYVVHHSLDLRSVPTATPAYGFRTNPDTGRWTDFYQAGTAVCMAPFFIAGHLAALAGGWPADGASAPYQWSIRLAGICWLALGLWAAWRFIAARAGPGTASLTIFALTLGTSLLHYAVAESSMSHVYAFALIACLLFCGDRFWTDPSPKMAALTGALCSLLIAVRGPDILAAAIVLYPALRTQNRPVVKRNAIGFILGAAIAILPYAFTSTYYLGAPWRTNYFGIPLDWFHPHFIAPLFGQERGVFFWSPLCALGIAGLIAGALSKAQRAYYVVCLAVLAAITYIMSCWPDPTFGNGFGNRMYVDWLAVVGVGLALIASRVRYPIFGLAALNLILMQAYWTQVLPQNGATWKSYVYAVWLPVRAVLGVDAPKDSTAPDGLSGEVSLVSTSLVKDKVTDKRDELTIQVAVVNRGAGLWLANTGKGRVEVAIKAYSNATCQGEPLGEWRFPVPADVAPGGSSKIDAHIRVNLIRPGSRFFCGELLSEGVAWFTKLPDAKMTPVEFADGQSGLASTRLPLKAGAVLPLSSEEAEGMLGQGWGGREPGLRWTVGPTAALNFRIEPFSRDLASKPLTLRFESFAIAAPGQTQEADFMVNGGAPVHFSWQPGVRKFIDVPFKAESNGNVSLVIRVLHPLQPGVLKNDPRALGVALVSMQVILQSRAPPK